MLRARGEPADAAVLLPMPSGPAWSFELKWDGFRALVSTEDGLAVRSRRGWNMTSVLPDLRSLPSGLILDGDTLVTAAGFPQGEGQKAQLVVYKLDAEE